MIRALTITLALVATPAMAEFVIEEGTFFVIERDYDHKTNTFSDGPPEGEGEGCFQITSANMAHKTIDIVLFSGTITPWWSDGQTFHPGFKNAYVPAVAFMENNPGAHWTDFLHKTLRTVPSCPSPAS